MAGRRVSAPVGGALFAATLFAWGGCALVLDLGPEAQLRPAEAGSGDAPTVPIETDAADAGADTGPVFVCGLQASPNATCANCIQSSCCAESITCSQDPACVAGLECIKDCMAQIECIITCFGNPNLEKVTSCSSRQCTPCTPGDQCSKLGSCCLATYDHADAGENRILRDVCRGVILGVDEPTCAQHLTAVAARPEAAPKCNGQQPPPPDSGSD
jgi:hypothetical protein